MPFKKVGKDKYVSPSGRKWTGKQVRAYHATDGFTKGGDDHLLKQGDKPASRRGKAGR